MIQMQRWEEKEKRQLPIAEWPKISETIMQSLKDGSEKYELKNEEHDRQFTMNSANMVASASEVFS